MTTVKALLILALLFLSGCYTTKREQTDQLATSASKSVPEQRGSEMKFQQVSLNQADQSQSMAEAMNRKILRSADLTLEVPDPSAAQRKSRRSRNRWAGLS